MNSINDNSERNKTPGSFLSAPRAWHFWAVRKFAKDPPCRSSKVGRRAGGVMKFPNSDFFENPWAGFRGPGSARFAQSFVASPAVIAVGCRMVVASLHRCRHRFRICPSATSSARSSMMSEGGKELETFRERTRNSRKEVWKTSVNGKSLKR